MLHANEALLCADRIHRALIGAGTAIHAGIGIDHILGVALADRLDRANRFAAAAFRARI